LACGFDIITKVDVDYAMETNEDLEIKEEIIRFIASKDKYWKATRIPRQNNKLVFELLDNQDSQDNSINRGL